MNLESMLSKAISMELQVSIQYMWQHVLAAGIEDFDSKTIFRDTAMAEMRHAEWIAERLWDMGEIPPTEPAKIELGDKLSEALKLDLDAEGETIKFYDKILAVAVEKQDKVTARLFRGIIKEEDDHFDLFATELNKVKGGAE
jgi:bacterioferritin